MVKRIQMTASELADSSGSDDAKMMTGLRTSLWSKAKAVTISGLIVSLVALNVLTLASDAIHSRAYRVLEWLAESAAGNAVARRLGRPILENSPTTSRKKAVRTATEKLEAEKRALSTQNEVLVKTNKDIDSKYTALRKTTNELDTKNAALLNANKELESSHAALQRTNKDLESKHDELKRVGQNNKVAVRKASGKIARRSVTVVARNISSMPAESIPFIGIAVIVGVTAWDVYDACQILKELNEMSTEIGNDAEDESKVCGVHVPTKEEVIEEMKSNSKEVYERAREWLNLPSH